VTETKTGFVICTMTRHTGLDCAS